MKGIHNMKPAARFRVQGLSFSGEWDEDNQMALISEVDGELGLAGRFLGFTLNIRGTIAAAMDNCLRIKVHSIGKLPNFLIPGILNLFTRFNSRLAEAALVKGDVIRIDPNRIIPDSSKIRVLIQPKNFEIAAETVGSFRERLLAWIEKNAGVMVKEAVDYILAIPDFITLCINLVGDSRVPAGLKLKIALCIAYLVSPVDLIPEFLAGPLGLVDDAVAMGLLVTSLITAIPPEIIRENWRGRPDVLEVILKGHACAGLLDKLPDGILKKLTALFGKAKDEAAAAK
jgi:uncharacterized membrane protein YkvA (DUF1232 family)